METTLWWLVAMTYGRNVLLWAVACVGGLFVGYYFVVTLTQGLPEVGLILTVVLYVLGMIELGRMNDQHWVQENMGSSWNRFPAFPAFEYIVCFAGALIAGMAIRGITLLI